MCPAGCRWSWASIAPRREPAGCSLPQPFPPAIGSGAVACGRLVVRFSPYCPPALKENAQPELHVTVAAAFGDLAESRVGDIGTGVTAIELRMIEDVIELGAKLHVIALLEAGVLVERPVPSIHPRSAQVGL